MATKSSDTSSSKDTTSKIGDTTTDAESVGGKKVEIDEERMNEYAKAHGSRAPSGQGGATPRTTPDHQDMFPPNPEPSKWANEKAKENEERDKELHG